MQFVAGITGVVLSFPLQALQKNFVPNVNEQLPPNVPKNKY